MNLRDRQAPGPRGVPEGEGLSVFFADSLTHSLNHSPMSSVEKDPFIWGRDSTMMDTTLPARPKSETAIRRTPDVTNSNILNWKAR